MAERYVIGVDGGTESLRAGVFDLQGRPRAFASSAYSTTFPQPGWAEQHPDDWWRALGSAVRLAVQVAQIRPDEVAALSRPSGNAGHRSDEIHQPSDGALSPPRTGDTHGRSLIVFTREKTRDQSEIPHLFTTFGL